MQWLSIRNQFGRHLSGDSLKKLSNFSFFRFFENTYFCQIFQAKSEKVDHFFRIKTSSTEQEIWNRAKENVTFESLLQNPPRGIGYWFLFVSLLKFESYDIFYAPFPSLSLSRWRFDTKKSNTYYASKRHLLSMRLGEGAWKIS